MLATYHFPLLCYLNNVGKLESDAGLHGPSLFLQKVRAHAHLSDQRLNSRVLVKDGRGISGTFIYSLANAS